MQAVLSPEICGNSIQDWILAALIVGAVAIFLTVMIRLVARRMKRLAAEPGLNLFDLSNALLKRTHSLFVLIASIYVSTFILRLGQAEARVLDVIAITAILVQTAVWLDTVIVFYTTKFLSEETDLNPGALATISAIGLLGRLALWTIFLLLILSNAGVNVSALIAGLGVIGVAAALSVQTVLRDLLASFSILLDKPFLRGHYIEVGDYQGTVEWIGL